MNARPYFNYLLLAIAGAWSPTHALAQTIPDSHVVPLKKFSVEALNKRIEVVHGDRTQAGVPFLIRIQAEAGFIVMPHTHPVDENIVVLKGSWALGMGGHYRKEALESMEPGDFGFAGHGIGAFSVKWVTPMYELSDKGVMLIETAEDPGRLTPSPPKDCFVLKLGTHVRGSLGEGDVIGAQCTPGDVTQYRIQKQDGKRFWGQLADLEVLKGNR